jgi:flagellar motor switch protein FliN
MESTAPYFWVRKITDELQTHDCVPLFGNAPGFDWNRFSSQISARFGTPQPLLFKPKASSWKSSKELKENLDSEFIVLSLKVGPLNGSAFWIMSKEAIKRFTSWMINGQAKSPALSSDILAEGYYRYLALQVMDSLSLMEPLQKVPLILSESTDLPTNDAFCIDVEIEFEKHSSWGKLIIDSTLQSSWVQHFSSEPATIREKTAEITEVTVGVKVGSSTLSQEEWKNLKKGDFLLLDQNSLDVRKHTGAAYLTLGDTSLFQVKIKQNKMQLLDYAFIHEETMPNNKPIEKTPLDEEMTQFREELPPAEEKTMPLKELPLHVTVELARLQITLDKLMKLSPGNIIELPLHPDQAVKLTVNGQLVGFAELIHLGETLGVRILSLG